MCSFKQPDIRPDPDAVWWRPCYYLNEDYKASWIDSENNLKKVKIPKGFHTDGSSEWTALIFLGFLPAGLFWLTGIRADGPHRGAAVVHDYLYKYSLTSRKEADSVFWQLCRKGGMPKWRADLRWIVLRAVGWHAYGKDFFKK